jgi:hypothetical protein
VKLAVFCVVAPCSLVKFTDVSEVLAASIIRAMNEHLVFLKGPELLYEVTEYQLLKYSAAHAMSYPSVVKQVRRRLKHQ